MAELAIWELAVLRYSARMAELAIGCERDKILCFHEFGVSDFGVSDTYVVFDVWERDVR